ncbi:hypothetical protein OAC99_01415 [Amylibacter sp.]|nr:hypothetical protein [Amylibacter sp.]
MISIRRSSKEDIIAVMGFIATHWDGQHILAQNRPLMDWQHGCEDGYNYILAWDEEILVGVLGYIPTRRYDDGLSAKNIVWLALWKVCDDYQSSMLGLKLLKHLESVEPGSVMAVSGINPSHPPMYKALGFEVYELGQYYLANPNKSQNLIQKPKNVSLATAMFGLASLKRLDFSDFENTRFSVPNSSEFKTFEYIKKRFISHPSYNYELYGISLEDSIRAVIATRIADYNGSRALRIVDFIGEEGVLGDCGSAFQALMAEQCVEHMDFWQSGISSEILVRAGFYKVDPAGELICPNYFEPFIAENARIKCCIKGSLDASFIVCRADGDQDRPNEVSVL